MESHRAMASGERASARDSADGQSLLISVVIPAYNEEQAIAAVVRDVIAQVPGLAAGDYVPVVIDARNSTRGLSCFAGKVWLA